MTTSSEFLLVVMQSHMPGLEEAVALALFAVQNQNLGQHRLATIENGCGRKIVDHVLSI